MMEIILSCHDHRRPRLYRDLIITKINAKWVNYVLLKYLASLWQQKGCKFISMNKRLL